jgi:hypothetical protein
MMVSNKRPKGRGSVFQRSENSWVGVLPRSMRPPHQVTGATEEEAIEKLDLILDGITQHKLNLPKTLGEKAEAKATENDTTLSRVVEPMLEAWVQEDWPRTTSTARGTE